VRQALAVLGAQLRISLLVAAAYRADFFVDAAVEILWTSTVLAPLLVVFGSRSQVAGWSFGEALIVVGFFTLLQALLEGVMNPSFVAVVEHVRRGTLDFVLLLPVDAQLLVSTGRFHLWRSVNVVTALSIFAVGFHEVGHPPSLSATLLGLTLFAASAVLLHAIWTLAMCTAFYAVKTDNITDVLSATLDASRWPSSVFRGAVRFTLTFVVPLGLMTSVPARAILGSVDASTCAVALGEAVLFALVARVAFVRALSRYASASS
jgi:ABC-2 type transport system permease protein